LTGMFKIIEECFDKRKGRESNPMRICPENRFAESA
jgi:hypothetical protein